MSEKQTLLICTVGGSPEPLVASIKHWTPERILFLPSAETEPEIQEKIIPLAKQEGAAISSGRLDKCVLPDAQDFTLCVRKVHDLTPTVHEWLARGESHQVVVDITGGTKCMTAALALQAHRWPCLFSYVGGQDRTKDGVGIVVSGKEKILHFDNPWDALGYQAIEDATPLFDRCDYAAAAAFIHAAMPRISSPSVKRELNAIEHLAEGYAAWDRFQHKKASEELEHVIKSANDLLQILGAQRRDELIGIVERHRAYLQSLLVGSDQPPTRAVVLDLLGNAKRRADEGRYDDAVARLYRATEAIAQCRLAEQYNIPNTSKVPLDRLPRPLCGDWRTRVNKEGNVKLALQDDYQLLRELKDPLGDRFAQLGLDDREKSPLATRNQSILAHGVTPVSKKVYDSLWQACIQLAQIEETELPCFPKLSSAQ